MILLWDMSPYVTPITLPMPTSAPMPTSDFDGDGTVGFPDFFLFAGQFGSSQGDEGYEAKYDLDGDGTIGFVDLLIFASDFGEEV